MSVLVRMRVLIAVLLALLGLQLGATSADGSTRPGGGSATKASLAATPGSIAVTVNGDVAGDTAGDLTLYQWTGTSFDYLDDFLVDTPATLPISHTFTALDPGTYYADWTDYSGAYSSGISGNPADPPGATNDPGTVAVTSGGAATTSMTLHRVFAVTGTVVDGSASPLPTAEIDAWPVVGGVRGSVVSAGTDADGAFTLSLRPGSYQIKVSADGYVPADLSPTISSTTDLGQIALQTGSPHSISGTVSGPSGAVSAADVELDRITSWGQEWMADAATGADGTYSFPGLSPDDYRVVVAESNDYLGASSDVALRTTDRTANLLLAAAGHVDVSGTVLDDQAAPLSGGQVSLVRVQPDGSGGWDVMDYLASTTTDGAGHYDFAQARAGWSYAVVVDATGLLTTWLGNTPDVSTGVAVTTATVLPTVTMIKPATVNGTVSGPGGPVADVEVTLFRWSADASAPNGGSFEFADAATTDVSGTYTIAGVTPGYYSVRFDGSGASPALGTSWTGNAQPSTTSDPGVFQLGVGATATKDMTLALAKIVSGTVSGPGGPAAGVDVVLYSWYDHGGGDTGFSGTGADAFTDAAGHYSLALPGAGSFALYFDASDAVDTLRSEWLGGLTSPTTTADPTVFTGASDVVKNKTLAKAQTANGSVTNNASAAIVGATVTAYAWDGSSWSQYASRTTDAGGAYGVRVPSSTTVTFRYSAPGYLPTYLGGGSSLPAAPTPANSVATGPSADVSIATVVLQPRPSTLGLHAGYTGAAYSWCKTTTLPANDDGSSPSVPIPFSLKFFGTPYDHLYVNNNGNVTFNGPRSTFTPSDITGNTGLPIIAPFFGDVDTRGDSNVVTYGTSPDGSKLCVNWADVGYFSTRTDKLDTFQLVLTKNAGGAGRVDGDFDITFNYDQVKWETGEASGGVGGLGGHSAVVGFSAGTGAAGTYVQMPGSLVNGAFLDGGPNSLIAGRQASAVNGRYIFEVRNEGLSSALGGLQGTVRNGSGTGIAGAGVEACTTSSCSTTTTGPTGHYSFTALLAGTYSVVVDPPSSSYFSGGASTTVTAGSIATADVVLGAPVLMPTGTTVNGVHSTGLPSVVYDEPMTLSLTGCPGVANPAYVVKLVDGTTVASGALTESPSGTYHATVPSFSDYGEAHLSTTVPVTCGGQTVGFDIYIDPSGTVTDQYGVPLPGATATLMRRDDEDINSNGNTTEYLTVPDGSTIMSASNRTNPSTTGSNGAFAWDVTPGTYEVATAATGCTGATSDSLSVPPARIDLLVKMTCGTTAPVPTSPPALAGVLKVGRTVKVVPGVWASPIAAGTTSLLRNGTPVALGAGGSYVVKAADVGASFTVTTTARRPDYVQEHGTGSTVTFVGTSATSTATIAGKATSTTKLAVAKTVRAGKVTVTVTVGGVGVVNPTGKVTVYDGRRKLTTVTLGAAQHGRIAVKVTLAKGKHSLKATYAGSASVAASTSTVVKVTAK